MLQITLPRAHEGFGAGNDNVAVIDLKRENMMPLGKCLGHNI